MAVNFVERIDGSVRVRRALVSVSDKTGLETFIPRLVDASPGLRVLSTGGTHKVLGEVLGARADECLTAVSEYTGQPEMQGGLVKTLDFKIYLGLLSETYNDAHKADLRRVNAEPIDMVVVNLYPFVQAVSAQGATPEQARANIDIGGPCMVRAAAKNYLRVVVLTDPADYDDVVSECEASGGGIGLDTRFRLARKAFAHTAAYDAAISEYLNKRELSEITDCYRLETE